MASDRKVRPADGLEGAMVGDVVKMEVPSEFRNIDLSLPDTTCGRLVRRYLDCELQRLSVARIKEVKGKSADALRKSMMTYKVKKFSEKKEQYLAHCKMVTQAIAPQEIESCMKKPCRAMDTCLKEVARRHNLPVSP